MKSPILKLYCIVYLISALQMLYTIISNIYLSRNDWSSSEKAIRWKICHK